jgi:hypothetical protein
MKHLIPPTECAYRLAGRTLGARDGGGRAVISDLTYTVLF